MSFYARERPPGWSRAMCMVLAHSAFDEYSNAGWTYERNASQAPVWCAEPFPVDHGSELLDAVILQLPPAGARWSEIRMAGCLSLLY